MTIATPAQVVTTAADRGSTSSGIFVQQIATGYSTRPSSKNLDSAVAGVGIVDYKGLEYYMSARNVRSASSGCREQLTPSDWEAQACLLTSTRTRAVTGTRAARRQAVATLYYAHCTRSLLVAFNARATLLHNCIHSRLHCPSTGRWEKLSILNPGLQPPGTLAPSVWRSNCVFLPDKAIDMI
ncbi:hypothetical protein RRG08_005742 [Elysia crispata]|uniref:Uncharacterized protein n=1 Tax=Elysia crispata TaxID=231223 RepID=A0AAE0YCQ2_9GAST|nr:hypothetical protein RRG08_005742 [Elysia crispata]